MKALKNLSKGIIYIFFISLTIWLALYYLTGLPPGSVETQGLVFIVGIIVFVFMIVKNKLTKAK